jgi:glycosyltransferase involved in cell wall biosynthesis
MSAPLVSLVVRSLGRPALSHALACIATQVHAPVEAVVVDAGGSGIGSVWLEGLDVRVVADGPFEPASAANAGMEAARGEWIGFLDEGDEIDAGHVTKLLAAAGATGTRVAYSQTRLTDGSRTVKVLGGPFNRNILLRANYISISALLFHRSLLDTGARFDPSLDSLEEWDFWLQLARHGSFAFTGEATASTRAPPGIAGVGAAVQLERQRALAQRDRIMAKWGSPGA